MAKSLKLVHRVCWMKFKIRRTDKFSKSFKKLAKKYKEIAIDYQNLLDMLASGDHNAIKVTENIYKIRLKNSLNPKGKSGDFRVVYFFKMQVN